MSDMQSAVDYMMKLQAENVGHFRDLEAKLDILRQMINLCSSQVEDYKDITQTILDAALDHGERS